MTDFFHQTTVSCVVFFMLFDVVVEVVDFPSKDSNLHFHRTSIAFMTGVLSDNFIFFSFEIAIIFLLLILNPSPRFWQVLEPRKGYSSLRQLLF